MALRRDLWWPLHVRLFGELDAEPLPHGPERTGRPGDEFWHQIAASTRHTAAPIIQLAWGRHGSAAAKGRPSLRRGSCSPGLLQSLPLHRILLPAPLGRDSEPEKGIRDMTYTVDDMAELVRYHLVLSEDDDDSATAVNLTDLVAAIKAMAVEHG